MTQDLIKMKLARFLELSNPLLDSKKHGLKEIAETIKTHKDLSRVYKMIRTLKYKGHCLGFAIVYGAMNRAGKLNWWLKLLYEIANWDGMKSSLQKMIALPDSEDPMPQTLGKLCWRALDYIVSQHNVIDCFHVPLYLNFPISQLRMLNPKAHLFEMIARDGTIENVNQRIMKLGIFSKERFSASLDRIEPFLEDSICVLSGSFHAIHLSKREGNWVLYDPNYDHLNYEDDIQAIDKVFSTKEALLDEIFSILWKEKSKYLQGMGIQLALFNPSLEQLVKNRNQDLAFFTSACKEICSNTPEQVDALYSALLNHGLIKHNLKWAFLSKIKLILAMAKKIENTLDLDLVIDDSKEEDQSSENQYCY